MLYLICNPTAGHGHAKKIIAAVQDKLKSIHKEFKCLLTEYQGHAAKLAEEAVKEKDCEIWSVGGDGTALEVASVLAGTEIPLGIVPAGTGNDFIKTLGYPSDPMAAIDHILSHSPQKTDVGFMKNQLFLNEAGTGFDVMVLGYAQKAKKYCRGLLPYLYGVICTTIHFKPIPLTYQIDDQPQVTEPAMVCAVANGGIIGGGIPIAPKANVEDGLFDVVIVRKISKKRFPLYLLKLMQGKILTFPETLYCRCKKITFSAPDMVLNLDGELKRVSSASLSVAEKAVLVRR